MGRGGMGMVLTFSEPGALSQVGLGMVLTFSEPGALGIETGSLGYGGNGHGHGANFFRTWCLKLVGPGANFFRTWCHRN